MEIALSSILLAIIYYLLRRSNQREEIEQLRGELMTQRLLVDKLQREKDELSKSDRRYKIVGNDGIEHVSISGYAFSMEQATRILNLLNASIVSPHRPYRMIPE